ncbi:methyltransferase domain-containing protein [Kribbella solani]|uniref:methyltransferase domain-containing protein n=1 Tax=Kribbella solani TaxID=236067 RepID=UPI0029BDC9AF|nr:methyltransferase domain-containing protein [Kribbella solani]MDX2968342.1 methyltransferase domain-containing protein [Kribbella solani]MDX3000751.1 methyltransferase domain-containing protein [Kribbella solani]
MSEAVQDAAARIDYDAWITGDTGDLIPQRTNATTIRDMVGLLDLKPGMTVMEVGTGTGYSGAVLAEMVGAPGRVVSLDVHPDLVQRAARRHKQAGNANVEVHTVDGYVGWPEAAPFDRVVGWTTPHVIPQTWADQSMDGAIILTPVKIADIAGAHAIVRCMVRDSRPTDGTLHIGSFIEMAPDVVTDFSVPIRYVDGARRLSEDETVWISAHQLHNQPKAAVDFLLAELEKDSPTAAFIDPQKVVTFTTYVLGVTAHPASAGTPHGWGFGVATRDGVAVVGYDGALITAGATDAADEIVALRDRWVQNGEPDHAALGVTFTGSSEGWIVRPSFTPVDGDAKR